MPEVTKLSITDLNFLQIGFTETHMFKIYTHEYTHKIFFVFKLKLSVS